MKSQTPEDTEGYNSIGEALKEHTGVISFLVILLLVKIGILPTHGLLLIVCALAGVWGVFELIASKYAIFAAIGWIIAALWMLFGDMGILSGY